MNTNSVSNPKILLESHALHHKLFSQPTNDLYSGDGFLDTLNDLVDGAKKATAVFTMPLVSGFINKI